VGAQRGLAGLADIPRGHDQLWGAAEGAAVGGLVLEFVLIVAAGAAALTVLAFAPGVRRLSWAGRLLLTGSLACPFTTGLAIASWIYVS
jgi:hypothetical protein